jgi:hypothetical protein
MSSYSRELPHVSPAVAQRIDREWFQYGGIDSAFDSRSGNALSKFGKPE